MRRHEIIIHRFQDHINQRYGMSHISNYTSLEVRIIQSIYIWDYESFHILCCQKVNSQCKKEFFRLSTVKKPKQIDIQIKTFYKSENLLYQQHYHFILNWHKSHHSQTVIVLYYAESSSHSNRSRSSITMNQNQR